MRSLLTSVGYFTSAPVEAVADRALGEACPEPEVLKPGEVGDCVDKFALDAN